MLTDEQRDAEAVIFARVCCPPGKHMLIGFEIWKACAERLLPVIEAANKKHQWLACNSLVRPGTILIEYTKLCEVVDTVKREAGL